jgi:hypothetical protein
MKNILHLQIPIFEGSKVKNSLSVSARLMGEFLYMIQEKLGNDYIVVASPCEPSLLSEDSLLWNFDMKQVSLNELKRMLKEE